MRMCKTTGECAAKALVALRERKQGWSGHEKRVGKGSLAERAAWDTKKAGHEGEQEGRKGKQQERQQERSELPLKPG